MKFWFFIAGMVEKSDSIAYDLLCQQRLLQDLAPDAPSEIVARDIRREYYPMPVTEWREFVARGDAPAPGDVVIYHYCDGWQEFEDRALLFQGAQLVWRWHNNTPPWFFMEKQEWVTNTMRGFRGVQKAIATGKWTFATNSRFTSRQLERLASTGFRHAVVYPASVQLQAKQLPARGAIPPQGPLKLLFVGRMVPHKSHPLVVEFAGNCAKALGRDVEVHFAGRPASEAYLAHLRSLAAVLPGVTLFLHGEVSPQALDELYLGSHVFVCFSQHEGFGLPVYEAMRYRLPVMASLTSAFEELLEGHPLCARGADLEAFTQRLRELLESPRVLDAALSHQEAVLQRYSEETIKAQLATLLRGGEATDPAPQGPSGPLVFPRSFDSTRQFFTPDDGLVFDQFLSQLDGYVPQRKLIRKGRWQYVDPERFSSHRPPRVTDELEWEFRDGDGIAPLDYLFFGPYVPLPTGLYRCQFGFDYLLPPGSPSVQLHFDCSMGGIHVLRSQNVALAAHEGRRTEQLEFYFEVPPHLSGHRTEFRCRSLSGWSPGLTFWFKWAGYLPVQV